MGRNTRSELTMRWMALALAVVLALPGIAAAQFEQQPAQDQYGQPPASQPGQGSGGEQSRGDDDGRAGNGAGGGSRNDGGDRLSDAGEGGGGVPLRDAEGGSLPFTGLDLTAVVLLGLLLAGTGFALRAGQRAAARRSG
jgi:hypothetical protein